MWGFFFLCFWWNIYVFDEIYQYLCPVLQSQLPLPCSVKFLVVQLHSGIIIFAKRSILNYWQCYEYFSLGNWSVNSDLMLCIVQDTSRIILAYSTLCFFIYMSTYLIIFTHTYSLSRQSQEYLGIFNTLCNPQIFTIFPYSELWHI